MLDATIDWPNQSTVQYLLHFPDRKNAFSFEPLETLVGTDDIETVSERVGSYKVWLTRDTNYLGVMVVSNWQVSPSYAPSLLGYIHQSFRVRSKIEQSPPGPNTDLLFEHPRF
jgi:hypothetical protein